MTSFSERRDKMSTPLLVIGTKNMPIDLNCLDIFADYQIDGTKLDLLHLDILLRAFTETEIKASIKRANIVYETELDAPLKILIANKKLPMITKDNADTLAFPFLLDYMLEQPDLLNDFKNKIFNQIDHLKSKDEVIKEQLKTELNLAIKSKEKAYILLVTNVVFRYLSYENKRNLVFYLSEKLGAILDWDSKIGCQRKIQKDKF